MGRKKIGRRVERHRASRKSVRAEAAREQRDRLLERRLIDLTVGEFLEFMAAREEGLSPIREGYISAEELGSTFGVRADTVRKWVARGRCPHLKVGRQIRFNIEQVQRWCEERAEAAGSWTAIHSERARTIGSNAEEE